MKNEEFLEIPHIEVEKTKRARSTFPLGGILYWLGRSIMAKRTLEIGLGFGHISIILAYLAKAENGLHEGIDINEKAVRGTRSAINEHGLTSWCELYKQPSLTFKPTVQYDLIFLDGCHEYDCVKEEFDVFWPHVSEYGFLCVHDIEADPGCRQFLQYIEHACREELNYVWFPHRNGFLIISHHNAPLDKQMWSQEERRRQARQWR